MTERLQRFIQAQDPERVLRADYAAAIAAAGATLPHPWPSGRYRLLLAGYSGAQNTGADIRTGEILRFFQTLPEAERPEIGVLSIGPLPTEWRAVTPEPLHGYPPDRVAELCAAYDAILVCEGSLFTSTFSDGLTSLLTSFLAMASAMGRKAVAVGAEADRMTPAMIDFVRTHLTGAGERLIITRNAPSTHRLTDLGIACETGTDTGWSYHPPREIDARAHLRLLGWDGRADIVALCPVDPFAWPLHLDPRRALQLQSERRHDPAHYGGLSFFNTSPDAAHRRERLLESMVDAIRLHGATRPQGVFPLIIGMEALDRPICQALAERLAAPPPVIAGDLAADMLIALLRAADRLISARFHAVLLSMAAGVPAIALAYDQRLPALLAEAGRSDLVLDVATPNLADRLAQCLHRLASDRDRTKRDFANFARRQAARQHQMLTRVATYLREGHHAGTKSE